MASWSKLRLKVAKIGFFFWGKKMMSGTTTSQENFANYRTTASVNHFYCYKNIIDKSIIKRTFTSDVLLGYFVFKYTQTCYIVFVSRQRPLSHLWCIRLSEILASQYLLWFLAKTFLIWVFNGMFNWWMGLCIPWYMLGSALGLGCRKWGGGLVKGPAPLAPTS